MEETCQRCHETLRGVDRYCPACGLPQLTYTSAETQQVAEDDGRPERGGLEGVLLGGESGIAWRPALETAILLAVPTGLFCSSLTPFGQTPLSVVWMVSASSWAVAVYAKRSRSGFVRLGLGARIGLVTGLLSGWLVVCANGLHLWVSRFLLHQGQQIDSVMADKVDGSMKIDQQLLTSLGATTSQIAQILQQARSSMLSPEGRAGETLSEAIFEAAILVLFAVLGGMLGARLRASARRSRT